MTAGAPPPEPGAQPGAAFAKRPRSGALQVGAGIFTSRLFGLVRESFKNAYLGATGSIAGDAFSAAFRVPNMLQNMLGEGALSAAFIPAYRRLLDEGDVEEAGRLAGAIAAVAALFIAVVVLLGVIFAPQLMFVLAPGFEGERFALTVDLTRILFAGGGFFVLSAWCLAIQNSHGKFMLSYMAPVAWNVAVIVTFIVYGRSTDLAAVARAAAWGSVVGAVLQFAIQLPVVLRLVTHLRLRLDIGRASVRTVLRNFAPVSLSRGVVQISALVDQAIASALPRGLVALLASSQTISMLPVSLFGMAVSASELPALSSARGDEEEQNRFRRDRLTASTRQVAFFIVPSAVAFILLGDTIFRVLFERRNFTPTDTMIGWSILAASSFGLLANTLGRLYANIFFARQDTRTPARFALLRVALSLSLGWFLALHGPRLLGIDQHWGGAGLGIAGGIAGWTELTLLRRGVQRVIGKVESPVAHLTRLWGIGLVAGAAAFAAKSALLGTHPVVEALGVFGTFGVVYVGMTAAAGIPESADLLRRIGLHRGAG